MASELFPEGFLWGAATSAYQVEGAVREGGRGESIWDRFCAIPGKIENGDTGEVAADHYHRWRDDVENMRDLGLAAYRFSVAWPRIFPDGKGKLNRKGLDFYATLVDALLAAGIAPAITLYHWDLPQALQDRGGWTNRDTALYFSDYAEALFQALGDRVSSWVTVNEPQVASFVGHAFGGHAPGLTDFAAAVAVSEELLRAHALAVEAYRETSPAKGKIGISLNLNPVYPFTDSLEDAAAARLADGFHNRWYLDPVLLGIYPQDMLDHYRQKRVAPRSDAKDLEALKRNKPDFLGINYYFPLRIQRVEPHHPMLGFAGASIPGCRKTEMGWEVYPEGLFDLLLRVTRDYGEIPIRITENGAAFRDEPVSQGQIQDDERIDYLRSHLLEARRAIDAGVKLEGYYVWSLMDNFEWSHGFSKRFGLTFTDFRTQNRTWKKSANWYQKVISTRGASLNE